MSETLAPYDPDRPACPDCRHVHGPGRCRAVFEQHGGDRVCECTRSEPAAGLRLGTLQERRLRQWPKDRIRPKSVALGVISLLAEVDALRTERVRRRDKHASDRLRALRRKVRNLRREVVFQAKGRQARLTHAYDRGRRQGAAHGDHKVRQIEDTLSLMAQQQAWYRERFGHIAGLLRSPDWLARCKTSPDSYLSGIAWLAEDAMRQPMFPDAAPAASEDGR